MLNTVNLLQEHDAFGYFLKTDNIHKRICVQKFGQVKDGLNLTLPLEISPDTVQSGPRKVLMDVTLMISND